MYESVKTRVRISRTLIKIRWVLLLTYNLSTQEAELGSLQRKLASQTSCNCKPQIQ